MSDMRRFMLPWEGWTWSENYLVDPDGNKYTPDLIKSSIFTYQLKQALVGSSGTVLSLRKELEARIARFNSVPEIVIRFAGTETVVHLKSSA